MMARSESTSPALRFENLTKSFGSSAVLRGVSFDVMPGEIHGLLGANGAGKSTLIKILAGVYHQDAGRIFVHGEEIDADHGPAAVQQAGIAFVHQDLGLVEDLSVADNIALHIGFQRRFGLIDGRATARAVAHAIAAVGASFHPEEHVGALSRDEQVLCALARALALDPKIVVLDEVSASLPGPEMRRLTTSLKALRRSGTAFIYVTHRLDELDSLVDRVTVLKDGIRAVTAPVAELEHAVLVRHIVGSDPVEVHPTSPTSREAGAEAAHLVVRELTGPGLPDPISFEIRAGEVLGVCGLVGSGTRELARLMTGNAKPSGGSATLGGRPLMLGHPDRLARSRCMVVPGDRQRDGMITGLSLRENLLPMRRDFGAWTRWGFRRPRAETAAIRRVMELFEVVPRDDPDRDASELSGGNQQKLVFARALTDRPEVAVLEDPTAGVDVGSRAVLYRFVQESAEAGTGVLLISTDFEEVAGQSHRVLVLSHGRIVAEFDRSQGFTADSLAEASYGLGTASVV
ncbi:sugar ABC transporter ATP-binding protein [Sphaerimonospora sp. CA-214678]|uniref:sugar ABC transporter ATP-binding protein n=1 Tax=Sphaerimonospora sp. CA-214678 TaxID=3240029 RepID=UPI003D8D4099